MTVFAFSVQDKTYHALPRVWRMEVAFGSPLDGGAPYFAPTEGSLRSSHHLRYSGEALLSSGSWKEKKLS